MFSGKSPFEMGKTSIAAHQELPEPCNETRKVLCEAAQPRRFHTTRLALTLTTMALPPQPLRWPRADGVIARRRAGRCMTQKRLVVSHLPMARDVAPSPESLSVNSTSPANGIRYDRPR